MKLNPSAQRCLKRFLLGILLLEPYISLIYAWKTNKYTNYSFSLLIMYGSFCMFRYYIAIFREGFYTAHHVTRHNMPIHNILSTASQLSISPKALETLPEYSNVMPKHAEATKHN